MSSGMRMGQARGWVLVGLGVVICVRAGVGQEAPDFDAIRKTDFDSAFDRPLVQEWVKRQLDGLFSAPEPLSFIWQRITATGRIRKPPKGLKYPSTPWSRRSTPPPLHATLGSPRTTGA